VPGPSGAIPRLLFHVEGSKASVAQLARGGVGPLACSQNDAKHANGDRPTLMEASGAAVVDPKLSSGPLGDQCCGPYGVDTFRVEGSKGSFAKPAEGAQNHPNVANGVVPWLPFRLILLAKTLAMIL
jgi:hypothetical protein